MSDPLRSAKLRPWHLDRVAVVYVRQSTPQQVHEHKESAARQYALADQAVVLGWPRDRVVTIDDDLGKSGQSIEGRVGFQRLLAEVALDRVGLILGLEMSRLARSCKDWQLDDEYERFVRSAPAALSDGAVSSIRALEKVVVTVDKGSERVDATLHWVGGATRSHVLARSVSRHRDQSAYPRLVARLGALCDGRLNAAAIADRLNAEGFHPPKRTCRFTPDMVLRLIGQLGLSRRQPHGSRVGLGRDEYRPGGLASRLGINRDTVRRWVKVAWVTVRRDENGHAVIWADDEELKRLRALHRLPRTWANKARLVKLKRPKPRPAR